ncbi:MAG: hemH [Rickettsiaceae bacterium]|jgi:ferrochelatase|nr:hemH [Rickettsiaceae bacterium]
MSKKDKKVAVILFNLGGPSHKTKVKDFLFNLFYDKAIINLPNPFRWIIAKFISSFRAKSSQANYDLIGGYSPIVENTENQAIALEKELNSRKKEVKVFTCMRYSYPRITDILEDIIRYSPKEILLLPLYPQFSSTTSGSSVEEFIKKAGPKVKNIPLKTVCCFYTESKFIDAHVNLISSQLEKLKDKDNIVIFSAHGLPKKIIESGDPYQWQVEQTVEKILAKLSFKPKKHVISYQSRVGPVEWIKPYTEDEIIKAAKEKLAIILVPIAFVSEHLETLVELDIEYKEIAHKFGAETYLRVPTLSTNKLFIESLADIAERFIAKDNCKTLSCEFNKLCIDKYSKCISEGN